MLVLLLVGTCASAQARASGAAAAAPAIDVLHYAARIDPNLASGTVRGRVSIELRIASTTQAVEFDAGELVIDAVREDGAALAFKKMGSRLRVTLPRPARVGARHEIEIDYHGAPRFGLEFHPQRSELYTIFSTDQWLVCINAPGERATLDLRVALPAGLKAVGNGRRMSTTTLDDGRELHRWRQSSPVPSYIYGFAAGRYVEAGERVAGVTLRYLSTDLQPEQLRRTFVDTGDMLRFFGARAGVAYRGEYSQALVAKTIGQELAGFSLMSEAYGRKVLDDPTAQSLIAHEAAHQWWGNMVTCQDWNHFWLNEGFANFMAAAYMQHRFGEAEYRKQVDGWKRRLDKLRADGADRALIFERWDAPSADDRAVVYQKGAYVLHLLREELGEQAFWRGIRAYTRAHYGRSVTTGDFQRAIQRASGRDLSTFFARWVEGPGENVAAPATPTAAMAGEQGTRDSISRASSTSASSKPGYNTPGSSTSAPSTSAPSSRDTTPVQPRP